MTKLGFIGLGIMGKPMAGHLLAAGHTVHVYDVSPEPVKELAAKGAVVCSHSKEVAQKSDIIFIMVPDTPDVEAVLFGKDGVTEGVRSNSIVVDMSSISPIATKEFAKKLAALGVKMLDAPVSGGDQGAINATLSIMVGGEPDVFEQIKPYFELMGKNIVHFGSSGMGQTVKLMNQILVAGNLNAVAEALVFGQKAGVDLDKAINAIKSGAAGSWQLATFGPLIIKRDFRPGFMIDLLQKDLNLVMETTAAMKMPLPVTSLIHQMYYSLQFAGEGRSGTQALVKVMESLAGVEAKSTG